MVQPEGAGRAFPAFPYPPYDIQLQFMGALYLALEQGGVGLFESPTGTGKTLSLICSSLQWLQDHRRREAAEAEAGSATATTKGACSGSSPEGRAGAGEEDKEDDDDAPGWMRGFGEHQERERQRQLQERQRRRIAKAKARLLGRGKMGAAGQRRGSRPGGTAAAGPEDPEEMEFLVDDRQSDGEGSGAGCCDGGSARKRSPGAAGLGSSSGSEGGSDAGSLLGEDEEVEVPRKRQIIFASRTHSQLSQFVGELQRTPFVDEMSVVALGSRKALCINDAVLRMQSASLINERCLELQKGSGNGAGGGKKAAVATGGGDAAGPMQRKARAGVGASGRCPFLASGTAAAATTRDMILAQPIDIEELAKLGRRKSVCPYYAARRVVPEADIILVPYSCLLVAETREALGLRLEGNVIIVDEGHNLVDAINSSHSAELATAQAATAERQLAAYFTRFQSRLTPSNCRHIQTLMRVAQELQVLTRAASGALHLTPAAAAGTGTASNGRGHAPPLAGTPHGGSCVLAVNDFLLRTGLDNLNLFKLVSYMRESKAVFKVAGFWQVQRMREAAFAAAAAARGAGFSRQTVEVAAAGGAADGMTGPGALHALVGFLKALTNADADGRIVVQLPTQQPQQPQQVATAGGGSSSTATAANGSSRGGSSGSGDSGGGTTDGQLKFVLLNAAAHFGRVVSAAHAVVLASGTLSPLASVLHLFPDVPPHRLHRFACGHVVGRERLLVLAVGAGPTGTPLDFRHAGRHSAATVDELGWLLLNVCQVVPGGVVLFFPSFSYADQVHARWRQSGLLRQLGARKRVFREPRAASGVEACLQQYKGCILASASGPSGSASTAHGSAAKAGDEASCVAEVTGAVMLCVVGGKLAEGINFGDALGRCVVMVGLPYPNPSDPELQERMRFMDRVAAASGAAAGGGLAAGAGAAARAATSGAGGAVPSHLATSQQQQQQQQQPPPPVGTQEDLALQRCEDGRDYYGSLCMKAVNQCVGRVIRHRGDWAAVLLVDTRWAAAVDARGQPVGPLAKLPAWIQQSLQVACSFGDAFGRLARFSRTMASAS